MGNKKIAEAVKSVVNDEPPVPEEPRALAPCPCGEVPTELLINLPKNSKYGHVAGNCCADWILEFKAGYPKNDNHLIAVATMAWDRGPRGKPE